MSAVNLLFYSLTCGILQFLESSIGDIINVLETFLNTLPSLIVLGVLFHHCKTFERLDFLWFTKYIKSSERNTAGVAPLDGNCPIVAH